LQDEDDLENNDDNDSFAFATTSTAIADKEDEEEAGLEGDGESWKAGIDELLNPTTSVARRQIILSELINSNQDIRDDVLTALRDRKIDPLLTPNAKKVQDGTRAVARQLASDILPSIAKSASDVNGGRSMIPQPSDVTKVGSKILSALSNQVQKNFENLQEDLSNPVERIPQRIEKQTSGVVTEVQNVFSETPVGLQEPPYRVVKRMKDYEIRDYEEYTVATTTIMGDREWVGEPVMKSPTNVATNGAAFNTLAAYLFGANREGTVMEMTTPVTTTSWGEMRFYLSPPPPSSLYPDPLESSSKYETGSVELKVVPEARLAVKRFTGFVTDGEISRQKDALVAALTLDGLYEMDVPHGEPITHVIFQYNPPYTVPVIRRNEIAIPIRKISSEYDEDIVSSTLLETEWSTASNGSSDETTKTTTTDGDDHGGTMDDVSPSDY